MDRFAGLKRLWRIHRLGLLVVLAVVALGLGLIGYLDSGESVSDAIYNTLSLLALNYTKPEGDPSTELEIARFMAPAASAFATFTALTALLVQQWTLVRAGRRRKHVIICGLGQRGMQLTRSFLATGARVTAIENDRGNAQIEAARRLGALVILGDASDVDVLRSAQAGQAVQLVAVCAEDATNAAIASRTSGLANEARGRVAAFCHVADPDLVEELTAVALATSSDRFTLEWFSVPDRAARLLVQEHAELAEAARDGRVPSLVVVGTDPLAECIVVNAVRAWRAISADAHRKVRITVVAGDAAHWVARLQAGFPGLEQAGELRAYEADLRGNPEEAAAALADATAVFVCAPTDTESLEAGFAVARTTYDDRRVVIRLLVENEGFADLLGETDLRANIRLFSLVERTCSAAMVTDGALETFARALHETYLEKEAESPSEDPARPVQPWDQLDDTFKEANRAQARDLSLKLSETNCALRPLTDWHEPLLELSTAEIEHLAELEHERWNRERKEHGWVAGERTNRPQKIHEYIDVGWERLPEHAKDFDRAFIEALPRNLAIAGYEIFRLG